MPWVYIITLLFNMFLKYNLEALSANNSYICIVGVTFLSEG